MDSLSSFMKFKELSELFENIYKSKRQEKRNYLQQFIIKYKIKAKELKKDNPSADISFYPILRLLLPNLERERSAYGIKEAKFARKIISMLCLPPEGSEALQLIKFRSSGRGVVDFAEAAYWVLRKHPFTTKNLSIVDVNKYLDNIANKNCENDARGVEDEIYYLFKSCSTQEQKWIIRIILKDLKLGIGQDVILNTYHPDAANFYSNNSDLKYLCETLSDVKISLHEIEISIFTPFRPMLLKRCDAYQFSKKLVNEMYYLESKFDGERSQMHMENGKFKYFTRKGFDFTNSFGDSYTNGIFTTLLKAAFKPLVKKIILDGEMMGWNKKSKTFGSKGMEFDVKHLNLDTTHQPCFCTFDILLLNNEILTNKPLKERINILKEVFTPIEGVIMLSELMESHCKQDIIDALNLSMDKEEEGIVFKHPDSIYKPNDRNSGWWKMKLEYFEDVMSDLDVIVMGGYYGEGRYRSQISGFLVGVGVSTEDGTPPIQFMSLARISSGLNNEELDIINKKLSSHWIKKNHETAINYGMLFGKDVPDVWIKPENSCILEVRASELVKSTKGEFKSPYVMRFPRILKVRFDKPYYGCLTTCELDELTKGNKVIQKLTKRHLCLEDIENINFSKKRKRQKFHVPEMEPVEQKTTLLEGYQFCVLTGTNEWKKEEAENAIRENGGSIVRTEGTKTNCILVGNDHPRIELLITYNKQYDIVKLDWLKNVIDKGVFTFYEPNDALFLSEKTHLKYQSLFDKYGDSYTQPATKSSLLESFKQIKQMGDYINPLPAEINDLCLENIFIFKNYCAYFDYNNLLDELEFKFFGGRISNVLNGDINIVIINSHDEHRRNEINLFMQKNFNKQVKIVSNNFICDKINKQND